jgi:hypothetical protein
MVILASLPDALAVNVDPADSEQSEEVNQAMAIVDRMAGFLSQAKGFSVAMDMGFDAVQDSGQKIEFGETRQIVLERPEHLRVDAVTRSGEKSHVVFDGKNITISYEKANVYAVDPKAGTVDDAIQYFTEDLDMRLPLAMMLNTQLKDVLDKKVREAAYVEESSIGGVSCDHIALRGDEVDMQVWIAKGDQPLPQRVVMTYKEDKGQPQFWAEFSNWNLAPEISEGLFVFSPPEGAKKIAFSPRQGMTSEGTDVVKEEKQ